MKKIILILLLVITPAFSYAGDPCLKIHFIDVGEGDSILIQSGAEGALIDTGNILNGHKLVRHLKENGVTRIDHLIITHPHPDHIMGVFFIVREFRMLNFYDNGFNLDATRNPVFPDYEKIFRQEKNYRVLKEKDMLKLGNASLEIIWPQYKKLSGGFNHNSIVIMLRYKNFKCLLTADIDSAAEEQLIKKGCDLDADVLKVAHHGAEDSTAEGFIKKVRPESAIISVDNNNKRGYPSKRVLDSLTRQGAKVFRTDIAGTILITVGQDGNYVISTEKPLPKYLP